MNTQTEQEEYQAAVKKVAHTEASKVAAMIAQEAGETAFHETYYRVFASVFEEVRDQLLTNGTFEGFECANHEGGDYHE